MSSSSQGVHSCATNSACGEECEGQAKARSSMTTGVVREEESRPRQTETSEPTLRNHLVNAFLFVGAAVIAYKCVNASLSKWCSSVPFSKDRDDRHMDLSD